MQLKSKSDNELVSHLKTLRGQEKDILAEILVYLLEVDRRKLYLSWKAGSSLFSFCMEELGYTKDETNLRIQAVRLMAVVPETGNKIREGDLSLTIAAKAQTAFRQEDRKRRDEKAPRLSVQEKAEVLDLLSKQSCRVGEKVLASHFPQVNLIPEKTKPVTATRTMIQFTATDELTAKFDKLKGLLAHKNFDGSWEGLFSELADIALEKMTKGLARPAKASADKKLAVNTLNDKRSKPMKNSLEPALKTAVESQSDLAQSDAQLHSLKPVVNEPTLQVSTAPVIQNVKEKENNVAHQALNNATNSIELESLTVASIGIDGNGSLKHLKHRNTPHQTRPTKDSDSAISLKPAEPVGAQRAAKRRRYISVHVKREVWRKAQSCCEYIDHQTGQRCSSAHALEIDHVQPLALGGSDDLSNLRLLCSAHNKFLAWKLWGECF